ncbi:hypothetical protein LCGC14_0321860 [marine sediment metagenome]|uniref:Uncharacterized protein n=1 Tax=marine sediment metagenome TaxID=412755 RepID=A0A0F9U1Q3_9ZZZZ
MTSFIIPVIGSRKVNNRLLSPTLAGTAYPTLRGYKPATKPGVIPCEES